LTEKEPLLLVGSTPFSRRGFLMLLWIVVAFCAISALWYAGVALGLVTRSAGPALLGYTSGTTVLGYWCGVLGFAIIFFEMLLWPRKRGRGYRLGKARVWMWWHIWLGLACLPLAIVHSGFTYGGPLTGILMIVFLVVIGSGAWGLAMQQMIPRKLLEEIPAETIATQRHVVLHQLIAEAGALIESMQPDDEDDEHGGASVATRSAVYRASQIQAFYRNQIVPYLNSEGLGAGPLASRSRSVTLFADLRRGSAVELGEAVNRLEVICETRRQLDRQYRMYRMLHNWLLIHLPLSVTLSALLVVHLFYALKFW
jgi:hypothetical protein